MALKTTENRTINGHSLIDGVNAITFQANINSTNPQDMTISYWQTDQALYKANRAVCRADQAEFEDYAYSIQDRMIVELAAKQETEAPTEE